MELSRDKIKEIINDDWLLMDDCEGNKNCDVVKELARIALASLEAEPVAWRSLYYENHGLLTGSKNVLASWQKQGWKCEPLYAAPPAPVTADNNFPMQPLVIDAHGTLRFKENPIVRTLLDYATVRGYGLNEMALEEFDAEDQMQLAQLIGYSLSGYGTLSYVTDESYERAAAAAPQQEV
ncbi:TPA: hypothetical protein ACJJXH_002267 [Enterobacter hormaechei subsp. hoffmannii]